MMCCSSSTSQMAEQEGSQGEEGDAVLKEIDVLFGRGQGPG